MTKTILIAVMLLFASISNAQNTRSVNKSTIPQSVVKDFARNANYVFQYGNTSFAPMVMIHFQKLGYDMGQVGVIMENLEYDPQNFDEVLKALWNNSSHDKDYMYMQFKSFGVSATTANYLAEYCREKFLKPKSENDISDSGHTLSGRNISPSSFNAEFSEGGKVVIHVKVDREGNIISKTVKSSPGSELTKIALQYLSQAKFSAAPDAPPEQSGEITLIFKHKSYDN